MNNLFYKLPKQTINRIERIFLIAQTDYYLRYYGTRLGILWAFINPFLQILIYYFAFSYLIGTGRGANFILYLFTGIITWEFFMETTKTSITLFMAKRFLLQNVKIEKVDFFISLLVSKMKGLGINFLIYFLFSIIFFHPFYSLKLLYLFPVLIGLILFTLGISFFLSTLYIFFKDLDHLWSVVLMAGFWTVPIVWDYKIIYEKYNLMLFNPITVYIINIREILIDNAIPDLDNMYLAIVISAVVAISGFLFMKHKSRKALEFL